MKRSTRRKRENFDRKRENQAPLVPEPLYHPEWIAYDPEGFARACEQFTKDMKRWEEQGF
jgi:hypothetical protein